MFYSIYHLAKAKRDQHGEEHCPLQRRAVNWIAQGVGEKARLAQVGEGGVEIECVAIGVLQFPQALVKALDELDL